MRNRYYFYLMIAFVEMVTFAGVCAAEEVSQPTTPAEAEAWQVFDRYQVKDDLVKDSTIGLMWMRCSVG